MNQLILNPFGQGIISNVDKMALKVAKQTTGVELVQKEQNFNLN